MAWPDDNPHSLIKIGLVTSQIGICHTERPSWKLPMGLKLTLMISAIYLAVVGLALMFAPLQFGIGAVPASASPELIAFLRLLGGPFLGIAVLNWWTRNQEPSSARNAIVVANVVGFGAVAANDVWSVFNGEAREAAKIFLVAHLLFTLAFVLFGRPKPGG
jgi:hypothetical protein